MARPKSTPTTTTTLGRPVAQMLLHKALHPIHALQAESHISQHKFPGVEMFEMEDGSMSGVIIRYRGHTHKIPAANIAQVYYGKEEPQKPEKPADTEI